MLIFPSAKPIQNRRRHLRDSGHLLLAILLMMALMVIAATYEAPRLVQQLKRDREEEMIHRGTEYARAIKKYYKKFGQYPTTIEQLESANNIRFLRKRYKDPLTKDGKWTLLHYTDVAATFVGTGGPGIPAGALGAQGQQGAGTPAGQLGSSPFGSSNASNPSGYNQGSSGGFGTSNFGSNANSQAAGANQNTLFQQQQSLSPSDQQGAFGSPSGSSSTQSSSFGSNSPSSGSSSFGSNPSTSAAGGTNNANAPSTTLGAQQGLAGQTFGAGAILGVASKSKDPTIRIYNKKKTYDEWQFIYNPVMDQANVLLKGPYSPSAFVGSSNIGSPAGLQNLLNQPNQPNQQQSPFGQQGGFGTQQPGGSNTQQTIPPGGQQYPPDQNH